MSEETPRALAELRRTYAESMLEAWDDLDAQSDLRRTFLESRRRLGSSSTGAPRARPLTVRRVEEQHEKKKKSGIHPMIIGVAIFVLLRIAFHLWQGN